MTTQKTLKIAIVGAGPSGLMLLKKILTAPLPPFEVTIFEKSNTLGAGMPYSPQGASQQHITNVSGNELPKMPIDLVNWIKSLPAHVAESFGVDQLDFNAYKPLPRLLFGQYLNTCFHLLLQSAKQLGIPVAIKNAEVTDLGLDSTTPSQIFVATAENTLLFDKVVVCTGHIWPKTHESKVKGYFDSPYPPQKLQTLINAKIAIKGSSLTAIDAIRSLAHANGKFVPQANGLLVFAKNESAEDFHITMHSRNALLPAVRFHLADTQLGKDEQLDKQELQEIMKANNGFVPIDYLFETRFKQMLAQKDPQFFEVIKNLSLEDFVETVLAIRQDQDAFELLEKEYESAQESISEEQTIPWKEQLGILSFVMNLPAKHFCAEDMLRLKKILMPLISVVIAYVPQSSVREMLALHKAGCLDLLAVDDDDDVIVVSDGSFAYGKKGEKIDVRNKFDVFIDCIGQKPIAFDDLPFKTLNAQQAISPGKLYFKDAREAERELANHNQQVRKDKTGNYYLSVPGIEIDDNFQVINHLGHANSNLYMMAVPFISGLNPDYSGLDFSETASTLIAKALTKTLNPNHHDQEKIS